MIASGSGGRLDPPATLLVPGWHDTERAVRHWKRRLLEWGWPPERIRGIGFQDRHGSNIEHAAELAEAVEELAGRCGADRVAVVAHSMGGLALREYLTTAASPRVHTAIFVGTPHRGTWAAYLAWGRGGAEMRPRSSFLNSLNARPLPAELSAHCISTPIDTRVVPGSSAVLAGTRCHRVRMPTHPGMLRHGATLALIRDLLLEGNDRNNGRTA